MIDRVEVSIIEEEQPRWLAFVNDEADVAYRVGYQFAPQAMPNGKVAPNLAKRGIRGFPVVEAAGQYYLFNMEDPVVGGYSAAQVALRRAIGLGIDSRKIIAYAYNGLGTVSQGPTLPNTTAYDPTLKTEVRRLRPGARARAARSLRLRRPDGDGWRERPDGSPLVLRVNSESQARFRKICEVLVKNMTALGIRVQIKIGQWPENLKSARAGNYQVWLVGGLSASPDSQGAFQRYDSKQIGGQNMARVRLPQFDAALRQAADAARRSRADRRLPRGRAHRPRLHAVQERPQPADARHDAKARDRLPPPRVLAGLVAVRRHRRRRARRREEDVGLSP